MAYVLASCRQFLTTGSGAPANKLDLGEGAWGATKWIPGQAWDDVNSTPVVPDTGSSPAQALIRDPFALCTASKNGSQAVSNIFLRSADCLAQTLTKALHGKRINSVSFPDKTLILTATNTIQPDHHPFARRPSNIYRYPG